MDLVEGELFLQQICLSGDFEEERKEVKSKRRRERGWTPGFREQIDFGVQTFSCIAAGTKQVSVSIEYRSNGTGSSVWDAAVVLAKYLEKSGRARNKNILELGAGTGFVGLYAAALGASHVVLTDLDECLPLLQANATKNPYCANTQVLALPWGCQSLPQSIPTDLDLILCADCLLPYATHLFKPLRDTILALLLGSPNSYLLLAYEERMDCSEFFSLLADVGIHCEHPIAPHEQDSTYSDPLQIFLFHCTLRK
mmetsp:Transcript_18592/g.24158  ORF Transcript_18592/g.24158 Transcript_18592/m.24158 type:complete len:254 (-) Transcript_18592:1191-1952(-)